MTDTLSPLRSSLEQQQTNSSEKLMKSITSTYSTSSLESQLRSLKDKSNHLSSQLTQQLATSQSGQNLLHIGPSLSTLPPDLHSLLQSLTPFKTDIVGFEETCHVELKRLEECQKEIECVSIRSEGALECARMYQDLLAAERDVRDFHSVKLEKELNILEQSSEERLKQTMERKKAIGSLERAALTTLHLVQELRNSSNHTTTIVGSTTEKAQFLIQLAPRVRRLESDAVRALTIALEKLLKLDDSKTKNEFQIEAKLELDEIGYCLRGLALLGRGKEAESTFATTASMPIIRGKVSMGKLDEGGPRGQCAGLFSLLDDILTDICNKYGSVIRLSESIFDVSSLNSTTSKMEIDLLTTGVWIPLATALLTDPSIKMAIFSPGIASILQANYSAIDLFLGELADRLDMSQQAQQRIYAHPATAEFYHKFNLPIYYQLRFGEACSSLNHAIDVILNNDGNWLTPYSTDSHQRTQHLKADTKFHLALFQHLHHLLLNFWMPDVILRPLTHRFLRGSIQMINRVLAFLQNELFNESNHWAQHLNDLAKIAFDLSTLHSFMNDQYLKVIFNSVASAPHQQQLKTLIKDLLQEASQAIPPITSQIYNNHITPILITNCNTPLAAVKGVAATYRMTNRPPPTNPSPFIVRILQPLRSFLKTNSMIIPNASQYLTIEDTTKLWTLEIVTQVTSKYHTSINELLETVKRTEMALKNRKSKLLQNVTGGMTDGDKVRLQLYLDYMEFKRNVLSLDQAGSQDFKVYADQHMAQMERMLVDVTTKSST